MFARKFRLPREAFKAVGRGGQIATTYFVVKFVQNTLGHNRFAVILGTKVAKTATRRHFWKRRLVENLRRWPNLRSDFLILGLPGLVMLDRAGLRRELESAAQKLFIHTP